MRASLDTNVIIHFYKAGLQDILFNFFDEGVFIYEQIRNIELENHGQEVLDKVDNDIALGKIELYTDQILKDLQVYKVFEHNVLKIEICMVAVIWVKYMQYHWLKQSVHIRW